MASIRRGRSSRRVTPGAVRGAALPAALLRLSLGPMLAYHGYNKVAGAGGLQGTTGWFDSLGLQPAHIHARMAAATEIGAGVGLVLGAASPLPEAAAVGLMAVAARTDHRGKGFFVFKGGWEYTAIVGAGALALAAMGPGRASVDGLRGARGGGAGRALLAAALGAGAAAALLATSYHPAPAEADPPEAPAA